MKKGRIRYSNIGALATLNSTIILRDSVIDVSNVGLYNSESGVKMVHGQIIFPKGG